VTDGSVAERRSISLDGEWTFVTDPNGIGIDEGWMGSDADWPDWARTVDVPKAWEEIDEFRDYTGRAWYRREVHVDDIRDSHAFIRFGAVDYETTV
jgi:beta-galactosidase/beta-glucuronidase